MDICLGTAQLGMKYGINNDNGFSENSSVEIIEYAISKGIRYFDTAPAYGISEKIIGRYISKNQNQDQIHIISKSNGNDSISEIDLTLKNLNVSYLDGYLFHKPNDMYDTIKVNNAIKIKQEGMAENIGVSVYTPKDALYAVAQDWIDYIQIPYNVLDQRLDQTSFFHDSKINGKKIFARSALLQGLLAMDLDKAAHIMPEAVEYLQRYDKISKEFGFSRTEAAIQYVKNNTNIDYLVFGVDSRMQLDDTINMFQKECNCEKMIAIIKENFKYIDDYIIMPNLWERKV